MPPARFASHRAAGRDHRLRRDAVPQVGGAADDVALDHRHLGAEPGGVGRGGVAGGPAADDHEARRHQARRRPPVRIPCPVRERASLRASEPALRRVGSLVQHLGIRRVARVDRAPMNQPAERTGPAADGERSGGRSGRAAKRRSTGSGRRGANHTRTGSTAPTRWPRCALDRPELCLRGSETTAEVTVAGRILLKRDTGKLVFATIAERGAEIQLFMSKAVIGDDGFAAVKALDRGDCVGHPRPGDDDTGRRAVRQGRPAGAARQVAPSAPRQVARPRRSRHAIRQAPRRPHRQRRRPAGSSTCATRSSPASAAPSRSAASSRSRRR